MKFEKFDKKFLKFVAIKAFEFDYMQSSKSYI